MKKIVSVLLVLLCFCLWGVAARADTGQTATITFQLADVPDELQDRTLLATVTTDPGNPAAAEAVLSSMNDFSATVEVEAGKTYYCNAAVQYDYGSDYPLAETSDVYCIEAAADGEYILTYALQTGFYESVTGENRYGTFTQETPPDDYDPEESAQIGCYLTAPEGFDQHVVVYLVNVYTGRRYTLDVYAANLLAALETDAESGKYQYLGARVTGDDEGRYTFAADSEYLTTEETANFHLTVTDTQNPDRELTTPSRESNAAVQQAAQYNGTQTATANPAPTVTPTTAQQPATKTRQIPFSVSLLIDLLLGGALILVIVLYFKTKKHKE